MSPRSTRDQRQLPRAHGDQPLEPKAANLHLQAAPHTWGRTRVPHGIGHEHPSRPAGTGTKRLNNGPIADGQPQNHSRARTYVAAQWKQRCA